MLDYEATHGCKVISFKFFYHCTFLSLLKVEIGAFLFFVVFLYFQIDTVKLSSMLIIYNKRFYYDYTVQNVFGSYVTLIVLCSLLLLLQSFLFPTSPLFYFFFFFFKIYLFIYFCGDPLSLVRVAYMNMGEDLFFFLSFFFYVGEQTT